MGAVRRNRKPKEKGIRERQFRKTRGKGRRGSHGEDFSYKFLPLKQTY
jgi:hypothetical protein